MPRFFVSKEDERDGVFLLSGETARHISRSLRMAVGDSVTLSDGEGNEYLCRLTAFTDDTVTAEIDTRRVGASEPTVSITLFQGYPKSDKMEYIIQKAVELGASEIVPFYSEFCVKRPEASRFDKIRERQQRIADEAAKQCGRCRLPRVLSPVGYKEMLRKAAESELVLFCYEGEDCRSVKSVLPENKPKSIAVIIGSEGGFSLREAEEARLSGAVSVGLGPRILRAETAGPSVLSILSFVYEM